METKIVDDKKGKLSFFDFLATLKWLFVFNLRLSPWAATTRIIIRIILDISPLFNAYIFARLIDKIINIAMSSNSSINEVIPFLGILLAYNLLISFFKSLYSYVSQVMVDMSQFNVPIILAKHINSLGIQTLENPDVVNKIQRAKETVTMSNSDFEVMILFVGSIMAFVSSLIVVVKIMPITVLIIVVATMPELITNRIYMRKSWRLWRSETENKRKANESVASLNDVTNLQEITITSSFKLISEVFTNFANRFVLEDLKIVRNWGITSYILGSVTDIASIFGYFSIFKNLFLKLISIGDVTFQMKALDMFVNSLTSTTNRFTGLYERSIRINEVKMVFDMKPMVEDGKMRMPVLKAAPGIKFENISFKYPGADNYIIKNLNLDIKPGQKIAIVGENGAGKTTLVKLLSRFYKIDEGAILLNDININDIKIDSWYKNLGVLFQDYNTYPYLTLKENIYLGRSDGTPDMSRIKKAAEQANVNSFVGDYKNGYDQVLSEKYKGGTRPSTGQWQKIAIARFFYRNSPVVVFDEPTASIDAVSEAEIFGKIYDFFTDKTVIIISHRFSTVRNADKIYVLEKGKIIESGTHDELIDLKSKYYNAFSIQADGYK